MKISKLGLLAEVMPYYGTLDEVYKLMGTMNRDTQKTWEKCRVQFGRITKRKTVTLTQNNFFKLLCSNDKEADIIFSIFKINEIEIKSIEQYKMFIECINKCNINKLVCIKNLYLHLSKHDNFNCSYAEACTKIVYDEEDRMIDTEYNRLLEMIEGNEFYIENIESYLYSDEIENRKISYLKRVIFVHREGNLKYLLSELANIIIRKKFKGACLCILCLYNTFWILKNKKTLAFSSLTNLKLEHIEIYVSKAYKYGRKIKIVHLRDEDKIWKIDKYFNKLEWNKNDRFFSCNNKAFIGCNNVVVSKTNFLSCKRFKICIDNDDLEHVGAMIRIYKCNQMIIEFDDKSCSLRSPKLINKSIIKNYANNKTCVIIDPDCIQNIYIKEESKSQYLNYDNIKYIKTDNHQFSKESVLLSLIQFQDNVLYKPISIDIDSSISTETDMNDCYEHLKIFSKCIVQNIKLKIEKQLNHNDIALLIGYISKISRMNHLHFNTKDPETVSFLMRELSLLKSDQSLTIEGREKLEWCDLFKFKHAFKNAKYIQIKE